MKQNIDLMDNPNCEHHYFESFYDAMAMLAKRFDLCHETVSGGKAAGRRGLSSPSDYRMQSLRDEWMQQAYYIFQNRPIDHPGYGPNDAMLYIAGSYLVIRLFHTGRIGQDWQVSEYRDTALPIAAKHYQEDCREMLDRSECKFFVDFIRDESIPINDDQAVSIFGEVVEPRPNHEN